MSSVHQAEASRVPLFWAAPDLAKAGYPVFPVKGKEPTVKGGFYASTTDLSQIAAWIEEGREHHDVAMPTGLPSSVIIIDADIPETFAEMQAKYGEPTVRTPRGGHWWFSHPRNGKVTSNNIRVGLDRKGDGGYVAVPPSRGRSWTRGIPNRTSLPVLPEEFWPKKMEGSGAPRVLAAERKERAASVIASHVAGIAAGKRHEHLKHLCGVLLSREVPAGDAEDILVTAWTKVGGDLTERAPREIPNTIRTTTQALAEGRATGVPKMEEITPGLYDELAQILGWIVKISFGRNGSHDSNVSNDRVFQDLAELQDPEEFPLSAVPLTVRQFVREAAASVGCPVDYMGISALAALSAAIGDTRRIVLKKDWTEGAAIFGMIVGGPASKKTPAMNLALRPVRERQMTLKTEYERQKEEYESALRDYEKAKKDGPSELRKPEKPTLVRTYADDTTVERLADILNENRRGLLIIKDELSGWLGAMNQYKQGGKGADRQFWLSVHTNQPVSVDRKSSDEPVIVGRPFVSVIGGIQPEVLPDFGKDRGDGLIDRFIPVYPKPRVGRWTDDEISDHVREEYANTLSNLYKLRHANDEEDPFPSRVGMTSEAKALFVAEYNKLHDELESPGFPQRLRPAWGKLEAYLARFALILAITRLAEVENPSRAETVTREDMAGAAKLLAYFKNHVRRVYTGLYGDSPSDRLAADLRDFLITAGGSWEGIASELHDALVSDYKPERPEDLAKAIRAIAKRSPLLDLEDLKRTQDRRPFRLTLKSADIADIAVMADDGFAGGGA